MYKEKPDWTTTGKSNVSREGKWSVGRSFYGLGSSGSNEEDDRLSPWLYHSLSPILHRIRLPREMGSSRENF